MLPFHGFCPLETLAPGIFPGPEVAGAVIHLFLVVVLATAIEGLLQVAVVNPLHLLAGAPVVVVLRRRLLVYGAKDGRNYDGYSGRNPFEYGNRRHGVTNIVNGVIEFER
jgi:hypothetical protein